ncbi:MAG: hypothetical protein ACOH2P_24595 [Pseudomonas sp.]
MNKLGITLLTVGVAAQLSLMVWHFSSDKSCPDTSNSPVSFQEQPPFKPLSSDSLAPTSSTDREPTENLSPAQDNPLLLSGETSGSERIPQKPAADTLEFSDMTMFQGISILAGLIALAGLLMAFFYTQKKPAIKFHISPPRPGSLLIFENLCLTCGQVIGYSRKEIKKAMPHQGVWVIEITLNATNKRRSIEAIRQLELSVVRREHNFIIVGPYRLKQNAAEILQELKEKYNVRGWLEAGN